MYKQNSIFFGQKGFFEKKKSYVQFSDCTVLTIAHRLCHAFEADRVMVMAEGRIQVAFHIVVCAKFSFGYKYFFIFL